MVEPAPEKNGSELPSPGVRLLYDIDKTRTVRYSNEKQLKSPSPWLERLGRKKCSYHYRSTRERGFPDLGRGQVEPHETVSQVAGELFLSVVLLHHRHGRLHVHLSLAKTTTAANTTTLTTITKNDNNNGGDDNINDDDDGDNSSSTNNDNNNRRVFATPNSVGLENM